MHLPQVTVAAMVLVSTETDGVNVGMTVVGIV